MAKMIDKTTQCRFRIVPCRGPEASGICRNPAAITGPAIECREGRVFDVRCPLSDAPDPERYRDAVRWLKKVRGLVPNYDALSVEIAAFLAGEDGG